MLQTTALKLGYKFAYCIEFTERIDFIDYLCTGEAIELRSQIEDNTVHCSW